MWPKKTGGGSPVDLPSVSPETSYSFQYTAALGTDNSAPGISPTAAPGLLPLLFQASLPLLLQAYLPLLFRELFPLLLKASLPLLFQGFQRLTLATGYIYIHPS